MGGSLPGALSCLEEPPTKVEQVDLCDFIVAATSSEIIGALARGTLKFPFMPHEIPVLFIERLVYLAEHADADLREKARRAAEGVSKALRRFRRE